MQTLGLVALAVLAVGSQLQAAERLVLDPAVVICDSAEPAYVQYGVRDLAAYIRELAGSEIPVLAGPEGAKGVRIVVGAMAARRVIADGLPDPQAGEEAYLLRALSNDGVEYVIAAGATPRGTKAALAALMRAIAVEGQSAFVPASLNVNGKPAVAKRGMHFNGWAFNSPYSFRAWTEEEWCRYLDILASQGVNLFYLWPFIEIMPVPLSPEDQAYLEECRRVVAYAQEKHGMEVWIMQCTNRVAKDRCGVDDPRRRPYWRPVQEDLNPGKPEDFAAIMASREAMYRIINNVDGVCNIDSDPGYCPESPLSDYFKAFVGFRELLDKHNLHGKQAKLVNWMWQGWGYTGESETQNDHQRRTIQGLKEHLAEPWRLIAGRGALLNPIRAEKVLQKTVFLPYGAIEDEPSYPATNLNIDSIRGQFDRFVSKTPELGGAMGNVQTPLLQFPDEYFFAAAMFDAEYRKRTEKEVLLDLAGYLYPDQRQLVAECYMALKEPDAGKIQALADQLDGVVGQNKLGRLGLFGRKLFPDGRIVAQALVMQLRMRVAGRRLAGDAVELPTKADCQKLLHDYCDSYLAWDTAHGWHRLWGWDSWPLDTPAGALQRMADVLGSQEAVEACLDQVARELAGRYEKQAVESGCIAPLKKAITASLSVRTLAQEATATASVAPKPKEYPVKAANDGRLSTLYWPGGLVENNTEWLQLTWDKPRTFDKVVVRFLQHRSMHGRTIHLQKEVSPGTWEDFATTIIPADAKAPHAVATFQLPAPVSLDKIRIVNLLDLFEIEIY